MTFICSTLHLHFTSSHLNSICSSSNSNKVRNKEKKLPLHIQLYRKREERCKEEERDENSFPTATPFFLLLLVLFKILNFGVEGNLLLYIGMGPLPKTRYPRVPRQSFNDVWRGSRLTAHGSPIWSAWHRGAAVSILWKKGTKARGLAKKEVWRQDVVAHRLWWWIYMGVAEWLRSGGNWTAPPSPGANQRDTSSIDYICAHLPMCVCVRKYMRMPEYVNTIYIRRPPISTRFA